MSRWIFRQGFRRQHTITYALPAAMREDYWTYEVKKGYLNISKVYCNATVNRVATTNVEDGRHRKSCGQLVNPNGELSFIVVL